MAHISDEFGPSLVALVLAQPPTPEPTPVPPDTGTKDDKVRVDG